MGKANLRSYGSTQNISPLPINPTLSYNVTTLVDPHMGFMLEAPRLGVCDLVQGWSEGLRLSPANGFAPREWTRTWLYESWKVNVTKRRSGVRYEGM